MRIVKIRILITVILLAIMTMLAFFFRGFFSESNMEKYTTVEQLKKSNVRVGSLIYKSAVAGWELETKEEQIDSYVAALTEMPEVLIVEPTGNIKCTHFAIFQEIKIVQVIQGDATVGDIAQCIFQGARIETQEDGVYLMSCGVNLMQVGNQYLLFCENSDMSNYSSTEYYLNKPGICYFNLSDDNIAMSYEEYGKYSDMYSCEYFAANEEAVDAIIEFKKELVGILKEKYEGLSEI